MDLHPDFMKKALSEHFLFFGVKFDLFPHTPLASTAAGPSNAVRQVTARAALNAERFSTPERLRAQFKADMVDDKLDSSHDLFQPFGGARLRVQLPSDEAPRTPVATRPRSRSPLPERSLRLDPNQSSVYILFCFSPEISKGYG